GAKADMARQRGLLRVAAGGGAVLVQHVPLAGELFDGAADEVPMLGVAGGRAQRPALAAAPHADRRVRALHRLGLTPGLLQRVVAAREVGGLLRQQPDEHLAGFLEAVAALPRRPELDAVGARLLHV